MAHLIISCESVSSRLRGFQSAEIHSYTSLSRMTNQNNALIEEIKAFARQNWKVITALFVGVVVGGMFVNRNIMGISVRNGGFIFTKDEPLPEELRINGTWVYKTDVQEKFLEFADKKCTSIVGTVDLVQSSDPKIFDVQGWRRACVDKNGISSKQDISWSSDIAVIVPGRNRLFFWLKTTDNPARYGFVSALVTKPSDSGSGNVINQQVIKGTMYYLNETDNSWIVAQIYLYQDKTSEASQIRGKYSF